MAVWLIEPFHAQRQRSVGNTLRRARWRWVRLCFYTCLWIHWGREWRSEVDICKTKRKIWTLSHTLFLHLLQLSAPLLELVKTAEPTGMCVSLPCAVWLYYSNMRTNFFFSKKPSCLTAGHFSQFLTSLVLPDPVTCFPINTLRWPESTSKGTLPLWIAPHLSLSFSPFDI